MSNSDSDKESSVTLPPKQIQRKVKEWIQLDQEVNDLKKKMALKRKRLKELEEELKGHLKDDDEFEVDDQVVIKEKKEKPAALNKDIFMAALREEVTKDEEKISKIMKKAETLRPTNVKINLKRSTIQKKIKDVGKVINK